MNTTVPAQEEQEQRPPRRPRSEGLSRREVKPLGKRLGRSWRRLRTGVSAVPSPRPHAGGDPALVRHGPPRPSPAAPRHSHGPTAPSALFPLVGFARKVPEGTGTPIPLYFHNTRATFVAAIPKKTKRWPPERKHLAFLVEVGEDLRKAKDTGEGKIKSLIYQVLSLKT